MEASLHAKMLKPNLDEMEVVFLGASQYLYNPATREAAGKKCEAIAGQFNLSGLVDIKVAYGGLMLDEDQVRGLIEQINNHKEVVAVIVFGHTFTLTGQWARPLRLLQKPIIHLDTDTLDKSIEEMVWDDMNEHQGAHGAYELNMALKHAGLRPMVVSGRHTDLEVHRQLGWLVRIAMELVQSRRENILSHGGTMRGVRGTFADPFELERVFGPNVVPIQPSEIREVMDTEVTASDTALLLEQWRARYDFAPGLVNGSEVVDDLMKEELKLEVALRKLCAKYGATAVTTAFENLGKVLNLPGAAVQNMMADGHGFGPEGHFVISYVVRALKLMGIDTDCVTTMIEDYVVLFEDNAEIGAHMLEVCPSTCAPGTRPLLKREALGIGSKEAMRLVFDVLMGDCSMTSVVYWNGKFRMIIGEVESIQPPTMRHMHVAKAKLRVKNHGGLSAFRAMWMKAKMPHHSGLSLIPTWVQRVWAEQKGIPCMVIGEDTTMDSFQAQIVTQFQLTGTPMDPN